MKKKNTLLQAATTLAAALCMNISFAQVAKTYISPDYYPIAVNQPKFELPEEVIITGSVKDEEGKPLANAKVKAALGEEYVTNANGTFSFTLKNDQVASQSIFASYDGLVTAVRSYNTVMVNTDFDIVLYKPRVCCALEIYDSLAIKPIKVFFKNNSTILSAKTKKQLDETSNLLKEDPTSTVQLTAHTANRKSLLQIADDRLDAIKNYLIEQKGISSDRINTDKTPDNIDTNSVDIKPE